jgi:HEAT repeat protein
MAAAWKFGYMDTNGKIAIEPRFSLASPFSEGLAAVRDEHGRYGYIDHTGRYVMAPQFEEAFAFSDGVAQVGDTNHLAGFIDRKGHWVVTPRYSSFSRGSSFAEGLACVETNVPAIRPPVAGDGADLPLKWGYINTNGQPVIDFKFEGVSAFSEGLAAVSLTNLCGYIDKTGAFAIQPQFDYAWNFSAGLARVQLQGKMAFINKQGEVVFTVAGGDSAGAFSDGLANISVRQGPGEAIWGYLDQTGHWVIKPQFQQASPFLHGLARVVVDDKLAYIDKAGRFVWGPKGYNESLADELTSQTSEAERLDNNREILRLAELMAPTNPPVTAVMLETGEFEEGITDSSVEVFTRFQNAAPEKTEAILLRLLKFTLPLKMRETMPDMALMLEGSVRHKAEGALIAMPSPMVVRALHEWLDQGLNAAEAGTLCRWSQVSDALHGLGQFRDATIVPAIVAAWQSGVFEKAAKSGDSGPFGVAAIPAINIRETVIETLADMPSPAAKSILAEAMNKEQFGEQIRDKAAAALVRLGDQSAREALLDGLDRYLATDQDTSESSRHVFAKYELEKLGDAKLIAAIQAKAAAAARRRPKLVMTPLVERMRINNLPIAELKRIAVEEKDLNRRLPAISILGDTGNSEMLPFLESLTLGTNENLGASQKNLFAGAVKGAIRNVHLREWQQPEKKP